MSAFSKIVVPALFLLGIGTALYADDAAPADGKETKVKKALTPAEIKARGESVGAELEADYQTVLRLKGVAEKKKDVIKLNCVNDRLVQLKAQMNIADTARSSIKGTDDPAALTSLNGDLEAAVTSVHKLREEAHTCLGEDELYKQESGVEVQHPDITDDPGVIDPTAGENGVETDPPGYASPFN